MWISDVCKCLCVWIQDLHETKNISQTVCVNISQTVCGCVREHLSNCVWMFVNISQTVCEQTTWPRILQATCNLYTSKLGQLKNTSEKKINKTNTDLFVLATTRIELLPLFVLQLDKIVLRDFGQLIFKSNVANLKIIRNTPGFKHTRFTASNIFMNIISFFLYLINLLQGAVTPSYELKEVSVSYFTYRVCFLKKGSIYPRLEQPRGRLFTRGKAAYLGEGCLPRRLFTWGKALFTLEKALFAQREGPVYSEGRICLPGGRFCLPRERLYSGESCLLRERFCLPGGRLCFPGEGPVYPGKSFFLTILQGSGFTAVFPAGCCWIACKVCEKLR